MPFIALERTTRARIDITQYAQPRQSIPADSIICQLCEERMVIKNGLIVRAHFAHYRQCTSEYEAHPESAEHLAGKEAVARALRTEFSEYFDADIQLEYRVPEARRVADVMAVFPMGWRVAHEVQLASITTEQLTQRTADYASAGIDVVWWLGKSADTPANRRWCEAQFGFSLALDIDYVIAQTLDF